MGKSASAPPAPDYIGAAKQQGIENLAAARQSNIMSNPNMYTPFGNQTVTYSSPTFDQSAYDAALAKSHTFVVNADIIEPTIQIFYDLTIRIKLREDQLPKNTIIRNNRYYIITATGDIKPLIL